jgi:hypothetical protein
VRHEDSREYGRFQRPLVEHLEAVVPRIARYFDETG